jgi:hypothetical protein
MQFPYAGRIVNLLDTPGHADFSEDTYRVLTAVDSALMVIDCAKGVEERTIKLMDVCRLRDTPIMTFINKLDREGRSPIELLDEIEKVLGIQCAPVTWPIGMGQRLKGVVTCSKTVHLYEPGATSRAAGLDDLPVGWTSPGWKHAIGSVMLAELRDELELVQGASHPFDLEAYLAGRQTPVFFGSAVNNFGVQLLLDFFVEHAPAPQARATTSREVEPARGEAHRLRVQDPGQHGSATPRPRRLHARLLGQVRAGMKALPRAQRQGGEARRCADLHGRGPRDRRRGLRRRHHRHAQPRHDQRSATPSPRARRWCSPASRTSRRRLFRRARAARSAQAQGSCRRAWRSCARKARRSSSSRCATTT